MGRKIDFVYVLENKLFDYLAYRGMKNLFLIDTNVFIDLEEAFKNKALSEHPAAILDEISMNPNYSLLITPGVFEELESKTRSKINNNPEISDPMFRLIEKIYADVGRVLDEIMQQRIYEEQSTKLDSKNFDYYRYQVTLAADEVFRVDKRKGEKNPISQVDKNLIALGMILSDNNYSFKEGLDVLVNLLSSDEHILRTLHCLKSLPAFKEYRIRAIPTRGNIKSFLNR